MKRNVRKVMARVGNLSRGVDAMLVEMEIACASVGVDASESCRRMRDEIRDIWLEACSCAEMAGWK